jgi:hypothetical protein
VWPCYYYWDFRLNRAAAEDRKDKIRIFNRNAEIEREHKAKMDELKKSFE